jgi:hypothetical protein
MRFYALLAAGVAMVVASLPLPAQLRNTFGPGQSGVTIHKPGDVGGSANFRAYSSGSSPSQYGAPDTNVLSNGYDSTTPFKFNYKDEPGQSSTLGPALAPSGGSQSIYQTLTGGVPDAPLSDGAVSSLLKRRSTLWFSEDYNRNVSQLKKDAAGKPITSLVPDGAGLYHDYIQSGEQAFRLKQYSLAFTRFRMACYIGMNDADSLLSMSHAQFAGKSYPLAAYYFRQTLNRLPKLASLPIRPKMFYEDRSEYVENIQGLDDHLSKKPQDSEAQLLRAYYAWFDADQSDGPAIARHALEMALAGNRGPELTQAIESFWAGMTATGKVKGELKPPASPKTSGAAH